MAIPLVSSLPTLFLLLSLLSAVTPFRLDVTHIDSAGNYTKLELFQRAAIRNKQRVSTLPKSQVPVHSSNSEYLLDLAIGTPARKFSAILDTGSDLIWTQCTPCARCFPQPTPLFHPSQSSTYSKLLCDTTLCEALPTSACRPECLYVYGYGDGSSTGGVLATETFTFGSETAQLGFGCGRSNQEDFSNASGIVGFGRGPLSLISQLGVGEFSYCFTSFADSKQSPLFLGSESNSLAFDRSQMKSTRLVRNPLQPTYYYLTLLGISVGGTRLRIPNETFELNNDGSGGLIIDSGTTVTLLQESAYALVKRELLRQVKLPIRNASSEGLDLCFSLPEGSKSPEVPKLVFHFEGADWELTRENFLAEDSGLLCLTILGGPGMSVFGNLQQQNTFIRYDLKKERLFFAPAQCD